MNPIASFLEKFARLRPPEGALRSALIKVSAELLGVELKDEHIRLHWGVVFLDVNPLIKNEIALRKLEIIAALNRELGAHKITDIR